MDHSLSILSLNVNGLLGKSRIKGLFKGYDIVFLQETHLTSEWQANNFFSQWEGKGFHSFGTNYSRGVSILLSNSVSYSVWG